MDGVKSPKILSENINSVIWCLYLTISKVYYHSMKNVNIVWGKPACPPCALAQPAVAATKCLNSLHFKWIGFWHLWVVSLVWVWLWFSLMSRFWLWSSFNIRWRAHSKPIQLGWRTSSKGTEGGLLQSPGLMMLIISVSRGTRKSVSSVIEPHVVEPYWWTTPPHNRLHQKYRMIVCIVCTVWSVLSILSDDVP